MERSEVTPADIAAAMKLSEGDAWHFAHNIVRYYKEPRQQKVGRKTRLIDALFKPGKRLLKKLHRWFQGQRLFHPCAHGGVRGRSCYTSAARHLGSRGIWTRDAKDCYPSISPEAFHKEMKALGFRHDTARLLTLLCTVRGRIPQGSPVSNDALNLFFWRLDERIRKIAAANHCRTSRVADDVVASDRAGLRGDDVMQAVEEELAARGISVNRRKRRKVGFQPNSGSQIIHSINVAQRAGTTVLKDHWHSAVAIAEGYVAGCRAAQPDSLMAIAGKRHKLTGWMNYCRQAKFGPAKHLYAQLRAGDRHVGRKLSALRISANKGRWWLVTRKKNEPMRIARIWRERLDASVKGSCDDLADV